MPGPMLDKEIKTYHKNPRTRDPEDRKALESNMRELGDLGGIIIDVNSGELIGGNFRSEIMDLKAEDVSITDKYEEPTETGTIAWGYVEFEGDRFQVSLVDWTPEQCERANITANSMGGDWDKDILKAEWDRDQIEEWGVPTENWNEDEPFEEADYSEKNKELDLDEYEDKILVKLDFSFEEHEFFQAQISRYGASKEQAVLTLLGYGEEE